MGHVTALKWNVFRYAFGAVKCLRCRGCVCVVFGSQTGESNTEDYSAGLGVEKRTELRFVFLCCLS